MKLRQVYEGVGRIVPGVNTTADVGPDETKKQAAKFGNKVDKDGRPAYFMHHKAHKNTNPNTLFNLGMTESKDIAYTSPNFDNEWDEATRYKEFKNIGKEKWIALAKKGKVVDYNTKTVKKINNTEAGDTKQFDKLDPKKQKRALQQISTGKVELPIVASYSDGWLELVGGNTRLTAAIKATGKGKVWQFDVPDNLQEADITDVASTSEIYVDMDGVLVDFFDAWTKLMGVKNWKDIKNINVALDKIRSTKDFWVNLKPTPNAFTLLDIIKKIKGNYKILSAPMADDHRVEPSKRAWVEQHLKAFPPDEVIITTNKKQYATQPDGTPNILIDDFGQNVAKWEAAGGVGFKHKDHKFERTAKALNKHFKESTISEGDLKMRYADFKDFVADKVKQPQKGHGKKEYDPRLLAKIYELLSGKDVTYDGKNYTIHDVEHSPRAMARRGRNPATENITEDNTQAITNLNEFVNRFSRMANLWNKSFSQSVMGPVPKPLTDDVNIKIRGIIQNLSKPQTPENLAGMSKAILQVKQRLDQFIALVNKTAQGNQMFQKPLTQFMLTLSNNASNVMPGPFITAMQGLLQKTAIQLKAGKSTTERELSKGEEKSKERIVKGMKKDKKGFAKRYGKDADAVMYATATKLAKG